MGQPIFKVIECIGMLEIVYRTSLGYERRSSSSRAAQWIHRLAG
jgi:hypothetical protein